MADHTVHVLSPPCVCATLVGAASFSSLRAAAASPAGGGRHGRERPRPAAGEKEAVAVGDDTAACSWEDVVIAAGMMGVQLAGAAYMVVLAPAMERGLDPLFLVTFGSLANAAFTLPFSVALERRLLWPPAEQLLSGRLLLRFVILALGGVTGFQALMLQGMKRTSPAIAAAMPNLTPGFIFVVAASLGFERVRLRCCYTWAKIVGTALCLGGAITMSVIQSATAPPSPSPPPASGWAAGCFCLLGAVVVLSCTTVLQAATMVGFPAPITLCTVTSFLGAVLTAAFQLLARGSLAAGTGLVGLRTVLALVLVGGVVSSACVAFQAWALKKKGPVVVSMFSPTQTVGSTVFSAIFLGRVVKPGSVVGMILLFSGLYVVLWAKKKETTIISSDDDSCSSMAVANKDGDDPEKQPLLSRRN
uniref:EamA domain-containing protein n=1 Tax=Oryza punctata TaxID=4537 RepID=A0A0E0MGQ2_ORYPU